MALIQESSALVAAYLVGDAKAFDELFARYAGRLLNFITRMIGDRERAEDLVQETFIRVYRHIHRFDQGRSFSTWIHTIASNLARNELRNRRRSPLVLTQQLDSASWQDEARLVEFEDSRMRPDEMFRLRELESVVGRSVSRLSDRHREVFVMRELEGNSYGDIARRTGTNRGTVKSRLNRARQNFAEEIEPYLE